MTKATIIFWGTTALLILGVWYIQHQRWQPEIDSAMNRFSNSNVFENNDLFDMNETAHPIILGNGNIAWPKSWNAEQAAAYRKRHGLR